jgi:hypothetical protein
MKNCKEKFVNLLKKNEAINIFLFIFVQAFIVGTITISDFHRYDLVLRFISSFFASILFSLIIFLCLLFIRTLFRRILLLLHKQSLDAETEKHNKHQSGLRRLFEKYEVMNIFLYIPAQVFVISVIILVAFFTIDLLGLIMLLLILSLSTLLSSVVFLCILFFRAVAPRCPIRCPHK